jgi:hypothetical protein
MPPEVQFIEGVLGVIVGFAYYWNGNLSRSACEDTWWGKLLEQFVGQRRAPLVLKYGLSALCIVVGATLVYENGFW